MSNDVLNDFIYDTKNIFKLVEEREDDILQRYKESTQLPRKEKKRIRKNLILEYSICQTMNDLYGRIKSIKKLF